MNKSLIDVVAIYCPETKKCYYLDPNKFGGTVTLRVDPLSKYASKSTKYNFSGDFESPWW